MEVISCRDVKKGKTLDLEMKLVARRGKKMLHVGKVPLVHDKLRELRTVLRVSIATVAKLKL